MLISRINSWIDSIYESRRKKHDHKPFINRELYESLHTGKLYIACIVGTRNNIVSKAIQHFSGPFSHFIAIANTEKAALTYPEKWRVLTKLAEYYNEKEIRIPDYLVLASADDDGMNYFDLSQYQLREMIIFEIPSNEDTIIKKFVSKEVMDSHYDYTGLVGQIVRGWRWLYSFFDDQKSWYCSEQADIFRRFKVQLSEKQDPNPTQIYKYCLKNHKIVYNSLKKLY